MSGWIHYLAMGVSALAVAAMGISLFVLLVRYAAEPFAPGIAFGPLIRRLLEGRPLKVESADEYSTANRQLKRRLRRNEWALHNQLQIVAWVFCAAMLSRLVIFASALVGSSLGGDLMAFFHDFQAHWVRWDSVGYISLAECWYGPETQEYIILLPIYPMLVRLLSPLMMGNAALAGTLISNIALVGAGWALFLLVQEQQGQVIARRAVQLFMFCPISVFFSVPYAESLFLFLTLLSILLARRQQFTAAVCVGALAAGTRLAGILTAIPIYLEMLKYERSIGLWPRHKGRCVMRLTGFTLMTAMVGLGTVSYLLINQQTMGHHLAFVQVQRNVWNQSFGSLANTLRYSIEMAFFNESVEWELGIWLPQCLSILMVVSLLLAVCMKMEPGDGVYTWMYLTLTLASTWLLNGPRMIASMYSLYPMLAGVTRKKGLYGAMLAVFLVGLIVCSYMYAVVGNLL